jgi:hypothetical protein
MQLTTMHGIAGLQSLRVTEPLDNWENSIGTITTTLKDIRNLHIIRLAWRTHDPSLSWSNLCSLLVCCPHLTDLDLTLSGQPLLSWVCLLRGYITSPYNVNVCIGQLQGPFRSMYTPPCSFAPGDNATLR